MRCPAWASHHFTHHVLNSQFILCDLRCDCTVKRWRLSLWGFWVVHYPLVVPQGNGWSSKTQMDKNQKREMNVNTKGTAAAARSHSLTEDAILYSLLDNAALGEGLFRTPLLPLNP